MVSFVSAPPNKRSDFFQAICGAIWAYAYAVYDIMYLVDLRFEIRGSNVSV